MNQSPKSITIIGWILIAMAAISLVSNILSINDPVRQELMDMHPLSPTIQNLLTYLGLVIMLVCGVAILKKQNWARFLYVGWGIFGFIFGIITAPLKIAMIPGFIIFLIMAFFLFRPRAKAYFKTTEVTNGS